MLAPAAVAVAIDMIGRVTTRRMAGLSSPGSAESTLDRQFSHFRHRTIDRYGAIVRICGCV
jgi:hypothetical protein